MWVSTYTHTAVKAMKVVKSTSATLQIDKMSVCNVKWCRATHETTPKSVGWCKEMIHT